MSTSERIGGRGPATDPSNPARAGSRTSPTDVSPALVCDHVSVGYGAQPVLHDLDLAVAQGEALALLGPSGSGKTTLLHAVAGFVGLTAGTIRLGGEVVATPTAGHPPEARDVGVVFQHYALWPHLSALDTVAYPLRRRGIAKADARRRAGDLLARMGLDDLQGRRPSELSGGQQQRVGLARALAADAHLYLFDEPTAHLDAPLRAALQQEVVERRRAARAAAVLATHDAAEALAVADRVALLRDGRVVQVGRPAAVYERPVDLWAAQLTGPASTLRVQVESVSEAGAQIRVGGVHVRVACAGPGLGQREALALVRPDWTSLGGPLPGQVRSVAYRGPHTDYRLATDAGGVEVRHAGAPRARVGERVRWTLHRAWLLA